MAVDGQAVSQGMPLETELRYYFNFHFAGRNIEFATFLSNLSRELRPQFPGLEMTMDWVRDCDRAGRVQMARDLLRRLRSCVRQDATFRIGFWDILWQLTEVSFKTFGIGWDEIGTDRNEIASLSRHYLIRECRIRVDHLRRVRSCPDTAEARAAFVVVDRMLRGVPVPASDICETGRTGDARSCGYAAYRAVAEGAVIPPQEVGWSTAEHLACRMRIFPQGLAEDVLASTESDPTAPATAECDDRIMLPALSPERIAARIAEDDSKRTAPANTVIAVWHVFVAAVMLPLVTVRAFRIPTILSTAPAVPAPASRQASSRPR